MKFVNIEIEKAHSSLGLFPAEFWPASPRKQGRGLFMPGLAGAGLFSGAARELWPGQLLSKQSRYKSEVSRFLRRGWSQGGARPPKNQGALDFAAKPLYSVHI